MSKNTDLIMGFHSHIYFDAATKAQAEALVGKIETKFEVKVGRFHCKPVGPHPMWSCQLAYQPNEFSGVMQWLTLNRSELIVFTHPITGDDLADHRDYAIWMGEAQELDLSIF